LVLLRTAFSTEALPLAQGKIRLAKIARMNSEAIIELELVGYRQGETQILEDISWSLRHGDHWAVLGSNGSGKSTLLRIACGYLWPTSGRVLRLGEELVDLRTLRRQIGWIAHDLPAAIPPRDTALATVVTGRIAQVGLKYFEGLAPTNADFTAARAMLDSLGCSHLANKPFGVLSQGERQQVLVARARMAQPLLLVLDEPCAGMDPGVRERFLGWLAESLTHEKTPTVVLVTHHVEEIVPGIGNTLMLAGGRVHAAGRTEEVVTKEAMEEVYGTRMERLDVVGGRRWGIWSCASHSSTQNKCSSPRKKS
jgi:iron complex transport system ATP-binding protein